MIVNFALYLIIGYAIGRYSAPRQPFPLLGTPIDPIANSNQRPEPGTEANTDKSPAPADPMPASSTAEVIKLCGAPTKSGRPCRRKVVGGGYCWQHRDKYAPKKPASGKR